MRKAVATSQQVSAPVDTNRIGEEDLASFSPELVTNDIFHFMNMICIIYSEL